jgi:hypothetical protein
MVATRRTSRLTATTLAVGSAFALVLLTGCSSGSDDNGGRADSGAAMAPAPADGEAAADAVAKEAVSQSGGSGSQAGEDAGDAVEQQKVISTGTVQLRADDVGQAIFDARKVVDAYAGTISEDDTETDEDGAPLRTRMVLRIPTADFGAAMADLEKVATLTASKRQTADVTTQVLDTDVRVEAQQRSIDRIQVLFDHATSIKDIVSIESELSRRQADLASLQAQQRYLADQTSLSTITLTIERTVAKAKPKPHHDEAGFLAGLSGGWSALKTFLVGASTVAGALLPWALLAAVLALPAWPLLRRLRRRPAPAPTS